MIKDPNSQEDEDRREEKNDLRRYWPGIIVILVLLLVGYLLRLVSAKPEPAVECVTVNEDLARAPKRVPIAPPFLIDDQVIVTGPASAVEEVLDGFDLILVRKCDLNYLGEPSGQEEPKRLDFPFPDDARGELTTRLYHVPDGQPVGEVVEAINKAGSSHHVFADPNLLTGLRHGVCGNPEHSDGGSPFGPPKLLPMGEEAAIKLFWEQWAFDAIDAGWSFKDELNGAAILHQGEGTLVAVFDTSPFLDPWNGTASGGGAAPIDTQETVKWVNPTMDVMPLALKVSYPEMVNVLTAPQGLAKIDPNAATDVRDHGLFVAGLVHAVTPASELRLIRVLNEIGCGDLFTLNEALGRFAGEVKRERGTLEGVVINLSLGVLNPEAGVILAECGPEDPENDIVSLCTTLSDAYHEGAVIVAAAGNESAGLSSPLPPQIPAAYEFVIGAEASNANGDRACFSNAGDVLAPGGEGGTVGTQPCASTVEDCSGDCDGAVISLVLFPPKADAYWPTHYGYWSGTSFSAPLVSGLAALTLQAGAKPAGADGVSATAWPNPVSVTTAIHCGIVPTPDGVINVPATLLDCLP